MIITKGLMHHPFEKLRAWVSRLLHRIKIRHDELHRIEVWYNKELHEK
jgi:hypothetical protein